MGAGGIRGLDGGGNIQMNITPEISKSILLYGHYTFSILRYLRDVKSHGQTGTRICDVTHDTGSKPTL